MGCYDRSERRGSDMHPGQVAEVEQFEPAEEKKPHKERKRIMNDIDKLHYKWKNLASTVETELKNSGNAPCHEHMDLMNISIEKFGVRENTLKEDSYILNISGDTSAGTCCWSDGGWLYFDSEMDALMYFYYILFSPLKTNCMDSEVPALNETIGIIEKVFEICFKEKGFCNSMLSNILLGSISDLWGSLNFGNHFHLNDKNKINYEIIEDDKMRDAYKELNDLACNFTLEVNQEKHLRLLEEWMSEWSERFV